MDQRAFPLTSLVFVFLALLASSAPAAVTEETFTVPLCQYFVLDQHGGPPVRMRVWNADACFVDMNYTDEYNRGWGVHAAKHNSVQGREANLTLLYRHSATNFEVYYLNTLATPNGQATIVIRKYQ